MDAEKLEQLSAFYKRHLLENVLPWWETRFVDKEHGGFLVYRDADGALLSTDKPIWVMGRITWMWSRLYNTYLLYTSPSPRDRTRSSMPSSA